MPTAVGVAQTVLEWITGQRAPARTGTRLMVILLVGFFFCAIVLEIRGMACARPDPARYSATWLIVAACIFVVGVSQFERTASRP